MVLAAWDPSRLVALEKDGLQCTTCCTEFCDPGPPAWDCCCFLDPATPAWDAETTYAQGDLVEDLYAGETKTFESKQDGNLNHETDYDNDWWLMVSVNGNCGNADWDSVSPWGGPGGTPRYYTITCKVVWKVSGAKTTFYSDVLEDEIQRNADCEWEVRGTDSDGSISDARIALNEFGVSRGYWEKIHVNQCTSAGVPDVGDVTYNAWVADDACSIVGSGTFDSTPIVAPRCGFRKLDAETLEFGDFTISWRPGRIPEWDGGTPYEVGDIVAHEGVFYKCTQAHTNQEPPNAAYWDVI